MTSPYIPNLPPTYPQGPRTIIMLEANRPPYQVSKGETNLTSSDTKYRDGNWYQEGTEWKDKSVSPPNWWKLSKIVSKTQAQWVLVSGGSGGVITSLRADDGNIASPNVGIVDVQGEVVANGVNTKPVFTVANVPFTAKWQVQVTSAVAPTPADTNAVGLAQFNNTDFTVDANGFVSLAGSGAGQTITGDDSTPLPPTSGNWNIIGQQAGTIPVVETNGTVLNSILRIEDRTWPTRFVVDPSSTVGLRGTYQTISAALTDATSGTDIFIRPGTYTENLTIKAGVNLVAFSGDSETPQVTIIGKMSFSGAGTVNISNIRLQTNSDNFLAISGSSASAVYLNNCYLNCSNATGISYSVSNGAASLRLTNCRGDISGASGRYWDITSTGFFTVKYCTFNNSSGVTAVQTIGGGTCFLDFSQFDFAFETSGSVVGRLFYCICDTGSLNVTSFTHGASTTIGAANCTFKGGTAAGLTVSSGATLSVNDCVVDSSNANSISGSGTLVNAGVAFSGTTSTIQPTQTAKNLAIGGITFDRGTNVLSTYTEGTFTPTITGGSTAGTTTYTAQNGFYTRIGNLVTVQGTVSYSGATGTGIAILGGLPFTIKNQTGGEPMGSVFVTNSIAWPASTTSVALQGIINTTTAKFTCSGTSAAGASIQLDNAAQTWVFSLTYQI